MHVWAAFYIHTFIIQCIRLEYEVIMSQRQYVYWIGRAHHAVGLDNLPPPIISHTEYSRTTQTLWRERKTYICFRVNLHLWHGVIMYHVRLANVSTVLDRFNAFLEVVRCYNARVHGGLGDEHDRHPWE